MTTKKPEELLSRMIVLAATGHEHQFDRGGKPYVLHVLRVMTGLRSDDLWRCMIALGHDLIKDAGLTYEKLRQEGFPERVVRGIAALTKLPGETEEEQLRKVLENEDACWVKLSDLEDNSDIRRLKGITEKDLARVQKYHRWYVAIKQRLEVGFVTGGPLV